MNRSRSTLPGLRLIRSLPHRLSTPLDHHLFYPFSVAVKRPMLSDSLRLHLAGILSGDTQRFRALTGQSFAQWSI